MGLTSAQIDTLIESTRSALETALSNPKPDYKIGGRLVNFAQYIKILREQLNGLLSMQADIPSENIRNFDSDITDQGDDNTEYEGDLDV